MTHPDTQFQEEMRTLLASLASPGVVNAARGMSEMVGQALSVSEPHVRLVPFHDIPELLGGPESEAVGIYLRIEGHISGQMMMIVPHNKALELVDLMMGLPIGSTQSINSMERSALAELGNITGTFFLNAISDNTGFSSRPSPPAVMVDMVGAILDIILATMDELFDSVLMIQATFLRDGREAEADFWIIPDRKTLNSVSNEA